MQVSLGREILSIVLKVLAVVFTFIFILGISDAWYNQNAISDGMCNVAVLPIEGVILPFAGYDDYSLVTTPGMVRSFIDDMNDDEFVQAVVFEINSPGGTPVASEQISEMIQDLTIPNISLIGDLGASGGYMIAAAADTVLASPMSDVGSIGVTMSYVENSKQNEEEGLTFVELSSGKFKDAGNPNKPLSDEERALFESDLDLVHKQFVSKVALMRNLPVEKVEALADGSTMPGVRALEAGLVDALGGRALAKRHLADKLGLTEDEIVFCEYTPPTILF
jgi:protease-4